MKKTIVTSLLILSFGTSYSHAIDVMPHRVTYQLSLLDSDKGSGLEDINGKTIFTLQRECDGWKSGEDYVMKMSLEGGNELLMASLFDSFEDNTGALFSFTVDEQSNYEPPIIFDGYASKQRDRGGDAYFSIEPDVPMALPENTYFPVAHTFKILEHAKAGKTLFNAHIFFGAKPDEALKKTNVIIGKKQPAMRDDISSELLLSDYYPVNVAYFDPSSKTGLPAYEILFHMQDNGVVLYYQIDYGDFRLSATLDEITSQDEPSC